VFEEYFVFISSYHAFSNIRQLRIPAVRPSTTGNTEIRGNPIRKNKTNRVLFLLSFDGSFVVEKDVLGTKCLCIEVLTVPNVGDSFTHVWSLTVIRNVPIFL
jgi:hypothetical protein